MKNRTKLLATVAVLMATVAFVGLYQGLRSWEIAESQKNVEEQLQSSPPVITQNEEQQVYFNDAWYSKKENIETVLVMGLDKFEEDIPKTESYRNHQQSDFLALLILDHEKKVCDVLSINRDTMVDMTELGIANQPIGTVNAQLALAHTYGSGGVDSCLNTVDAVSNFLYGTEIDHYLSMTLDVVPLVNDAVGGVTLTVKEDFSEIDPSMKQGEEVTLKGEQALLYVQNRRNVGDRSNINRMERQQQYMTALYEQLQLKFKQDDNFMLQLLTELSPYIVSDYSIHQASGYLDSGLEYQLGEFHSIAGDAVEGEKFMEFYADDKALKEQIIQLLYEKAEQ